MCGVGRPYSSLCRLAAFYPCPQMLAVCYQLDTASEETGSGKDGLQSPSTQHSLGLQLPSGEPNTSEEHPKAWGAMECGAPAGQHFLRCVICVPQPFPEGEGGGPGAPRAAAAWCQLFVQTFEMFFSIKCRALYNFSAPHKTLDFCFRFPIAVTCADVSDSGQTSRHMCC